MEETPRPRKRPRLIYSCKACHARKVKCDLERPSCSRCLRRQETCEWTCAPQVILPSDRSSDDAQTATELIPTSASLVDTTFAAIPSYQSPASTASPIAGPSSAPSTHRTAAAVSRSDIALQESFDHHVLQDQDIQVGPTLPWSDQANGALPEADEVNLFIAFPFNMGGAPAIKADLLKAVVAAIPSEHESNILIEEYFAHLEWIHHPLDTLSFRAEYIRFWSLPPSRRHVDTAPIWLAMYCTVLSLTLHFRRSGELTREEALFRSAQVALSLSNFVTHHTLESIATIILMGLRLNNRDASHSHKILLAMAVRSAHVLGLHRLGPDEGHVAHASRREYARRLWWSLVTQDSYIASSISFSYLIHNDQNKCALFKNVYDSDLRPEATMLISRPPTEHAEMLYHIHKIVPAQITRRFSDLVNRDGEPSYSEILELDRAFRKAYNDLPATLNPDRAHLLPTASASKPEHIYQRLFMGFTLHNRLMRIHRAYMARGYEDPTYRYSSETAVSAARSIMELAEQGKICGFPGLRWWVVLVHIFTAAVVAAVDLIHTPGDLDDVGIAAKVEAQWELMERAIAILKDATNVSLVAARAHKVLQMALNQDRSRRKRPSSPARSDGVASALTPLPDEPSLAEIAEWLEGPINWDAILSADMTNGI